MTQRKILTLFILFILLLIIAATGVFSVSGANAQTSSPESSVSSSLKPVQANRLELIKNTGKAAIELRIVSLNKLNTRIANAKKVSSDKKTQLSNQVQVNITGLTALKTKLASDSDIKTAQTDRQGIYTGFRIYAVFIPKTRLLLVSEVINSIADDLLSKQGKLNDEAGAMQINPPKGDEILALLKDMKEKSEAAKTKSSVITSKVTPLTAANYPGSSQTLTNAFKDAKAASEDIKTAIEDARKIREIIKSEKKS